MCYLKKKLFNTDNKTCLAENNFIVTLLNQIKQKNNLSLTYKKTHQKNTSMY